MSPAPSTPQGRPKRSDRPGKTTGELMTVQQQVQPEPLAPLRPEGRSTAITWLRRALLVFVLAAAVYALVSKWRPVSQTLLALPWYSVLFSECAVVLGVLAGTLAWQTIVDDLGSPIGMFKGAQIMLVGSLGKYVPGSVWAYLLQMELGRKAGLPRARIFTGSLIHVGVSIVASLMLGVAALPVVLHDQAMRGAAWLFALLPIGLIALHPRILTRATSLVLRILKRPPLDHRLRWSTIGKVLGLLLLSYLLLGTHLWLLANSVGTAGVAGLMLCSGAIAVGLTAGLFFFVLPSGAGVREAVVTASLAATMGSVDKALAFAVASRLMFIVADLVTAGVAALLARRHGEAVPSPS
jgi:uncharacterized membrane protein YbhN (UPF0104 family)